MTVGLTGGIGSGKSTVAKMFRELGVPVYDSDVEAKLLMNTSKKIRKEITRLLGEKAYKNDSLDREYISNKVFQDSQLLKGLNNIVHPEVEAHFLAWREKQDVPYVIQETALIFENNSQDRYDTIILVTAPVDIRVSRVVARDKITKSQVLQRIFNQLKDSKKANGANFIIENVDLEKTREKVAFIHNKLLLQV